MSTLIALFTIRIQCYFYLCFTVAWGPLAWAEREIFGPGWWYDTLGHTIFGIALTITIFRFTRGKLSGRVTRAVITIIGVLCTAIGWEFFEQSLDLYIHPVFTALARAQGPWPDTICDIVFTTLPSLLFFAYLSKRQT